MPRKVRNPLKGDQLALILDEIKQGDRVNCPLGDGLLVYWTSHSMIWVMVSATTSCPVWRHECFKVEVSSDA
jgi:hypothetical protein